MNTLTVGVAFDALLPASSECAEFITRRPEFVETGTLEQSYCSSRAELVKARLNALGIYPDAGREE
jgi:hypothetical protein